MYKRTDLTSKSSQASLRPDFIAKTVADIDFDYLKSLGITTCFIDLDGTVVSRGTFEVEPLIKARLKDSGLDIKIATNRPKSRDLKELKEDLSASGVIHPQGLYGKPTKRYIRAALKEYGLRGNQVVMIGDRFLQDIFGANRSGVYSLVVYKLGKSKGRLDELLSNIERKVTQRLQGSYRKV
jgi:hypothetical protein